MPKLQTTINALKGTIKFVESHSVVTLACDDSFVRMLKDALEQLEEQKMEVSGEAECWGEEKQVGYFLCSIHT